MRASLRPEFLPVLIGLLACGYGPEVGPISGFGGSPDSGLTDSTVVPPSFPPTGQGGAGPVADAAVDDAGDDVAPEAPLRHYWRSVAAGSGYSCAVTTTDNLYCWGSNTFGQLGTGDTDPRDTPTRIGSQYRWRMVAVDRSTQSGQHTCAVRLNGELFCWGSNYSSQFAPGFEPSVPNPTRIGTDGDWRSVSTGRVHTCAIKEDGGLYCWGENGDYQLGFLFRQDVDTPQRVGIDYRWRSVSASTGHTCGVKTDGSLYCWGALRRTLSGALYVKTPTLVDDALDWSAVSTAIAHTCAVRATGELLCWGTNHGGELGNGTYDEQHQPTVVGDATTWQTIATGQANSCGLRSGGRLFCWGDNVFGQIGDGSTEPRTSPIQVGNDDDWLSISVGPRHACGLRKAGRLFCWGSNAYGQVGDGTNSDRHVPTFVRR